MNCLLLSPFSLIAITIYFPASLFHYFLFYLSNSAYRTVCKPSVCLSIHLVLFCLFYLSSCLCICLSLMALFPVCLCWAIPVYLSIHLFLYPSVYQTVCISISVLAYSCFFLSIKLYPSIYRYIDLCVNVIFVEQEHEKLVSIHYPNITFLRCYLSLVWAVSIYLSLC